MEHDDCMSLMQLPSERHSHLISLPIKCSIVYRTQFVRSIYSEKFIMYLINSTRILKLYEGIKKVLLIQCHGINQVGENRSR